MIYMLNSFSCMLVALALGYFTGMISENAVALNGINNVLSLGLCFLGGVFVPLEMLGNGIVSIAQFLPTYWYSRINGILRDYGEIEQRAVAHHMGGTPHSAGICTGMLWSDNDAAQGTAAGARIRRMTMF